MIVLQELVLGGIGWDPEIRGVLTVVTACVILMGSVYLLLATNVGSRLGLLIALSAIFGWTMLMGVFWWIYGKGYVGSKPSWEVLEINVGDLSQARTDPVRDLPDPDELPELDDVAEVDPDVEGQFEEGDEPSLSEIAAVAPDAIEEFDFGGWSVIPQTDLGESQTSADAALIEGPSAPFAEITEYAVLGGFEQGGKPRPESDSSIDRAVNRVTNSLRVTHPPRYAVILVQPTLTDPNAVPAGSAPIPAEPDPNQPVYAVVMERDIGTLRLAPALITVGSGALFGLSLWALHRRDIAAWEATQAAEPDAEPG